MKPKQMESHDYALVVDGALYLAGVLEMEQLTAKHGGDTLTVMERLDRPEIAKAVESRMVEITHSGDLAKAESHALLRRALERLDQALDSGELGASTVVRIADLAHRITGMSQPLREVSTNEQSKFSVNIIYNTQEKAQVLPFVEIVNERGQL
jgi:hypothetical protein